MSRPTEPCWLLDDTYKPLFAFVMYRELFILSLSCIIMDVEP